MHTAICAFDERRRAEEAVDTLVRAGFDRHDIHIEHKQSTPDGGWKGTHREEGDRSALSALGHFFTSLLGADNPSGQADTYSQHVERGGYVVVVDGQDDDAAQRASTLLQGLQGGDLKVVDRTRQRPLREIVGSHEGIAGMVERSREPYETTSMAGERAMASHRLDATAGPALRDPDVTHAPGLRYADQDKPNS